MKRKTIPHHHTRRDRRPRRSVCKRFCLWNWWRRMRKEGFSCTSLYRTLLQSFAAQNPAPSRRELFCMAQINVKPSPWWEPTFASLTRQVFLWEMLAVAEGDWWCDPTQRIFFKHFRIASPHIVILARLSWTVEDAGPYGYGGSVPLCVSFLDTRSVRQETVKRFKPHNPLAAKNLI